MSDPWSANVSLLLHCNGDNNSTVFTDASHHQHATTVFGNAKISTAQAKYGGSSAAFDGAGDYLTVAHSVLFSLLSDFTVEFWLYSAAGSSGNLLGKGGASTVNYHWDLYLNSNGSVFAQLGRSQATLARNTVTSTTAINNAQWHYVAFCRIDNTLKLFIDGIQEGGDVAVTITPLDATQPLDIASYMRSSDYFPGYLQDIRITKGVCRYLGNFTPPVALLDNPDHGVIRVPPFPPRADCVDGGRFRIADNVSRLGAMGRYRVALFDRRSKRAIRETWSAHNGSYAFENIAYRLGGYFIVAFDHSGTPVNAAIGDYITPEPMPS